MSVNPRNLTIPKGAETPTLGQTRATINGGLEWFDSSTQAWRPAIRQHLIRNRLLRQAKAREGTYVHPRGHGTGNNETAPLREDLNYGGSWATRPPLLFQLRPDKNQRCVEPTGVLMYSDRVMLDPFDHPIRDFGRDLPIVLSTELKGDEVEHYLRRNLAIKVYDLISRMLNGYTIKNKTHTGPPRMLAVRERATKFREKAGCLAWTKRDGSNPINDYILSLLPAGATTNRALGGDLTAQQVAERKAVNKGKYGNRRRKAKREAEAKEQGQEDSSDDSLKGDEDGEEAALGEEIDEDAVGEGEEYDASPTRSNPYESDEQNLTMSLGLNSESFATLGSGTGGRQRSDQHRGHKRGIDEDSSDTNPTPVNRNIKRRKIDTSDEGTALGASHSNVPSQRASRKSRMSSSYSSLNQKKAADAPGRRKRAITAGGGNRRKHIATAPAKRESSSECEGFSPTSSLLPEIGSTSEIDEDVLMRAVSDVTSGDNGYEASSEGAGTDKPDSSSEIDDDTPAETSDGLNPEDTRFRIPSNGPEINRLRRALQITVADFALRSGTGENNLGEAYDLFEHEDESYISQRYHMQQVFDSVCKEKGLGQLHPLFCLPEWTGGFGNWNFELGDDKGPWLQQMLQEDTAGHQ